MIGWCLKRAGLLLQADMPFLYVKEENSLGLWSLFGRKVIRIELIFERTKEVTV